MIGPDIRHSLKQSRVLVYTYHYGAYNMHYHWVNARVVGFEPWNRLGGTALGPDSTDS